MSRTLSLLLLTLVFVPCTLASIIHVPADQPTIQAGINAAVNGDTVLVAPGTYSESINFNGKAITVESSNGASVTTIAVPASSFGVTFNHAETSSSVLKGFTIQGANDTFGIVIDSSPTILGNIITGNHSCDGAGISVNGGSPVIKGNTIRGNFHDLCSGGSGGGGMSVGGPSSAAQIIGNVISGNDGGNGFSGGGISLFAAGSPYIANNLIANNNTQSAGGGIGIGGCCANAIIVQNVIVGNTAGTSGGGIYSFGNLGTPTIANNTVANNQSGNGIGSGIYTNSYTGDPTRIYNNIVIGLSGETALYCDNFNTTTVAVFFSNDVYAPSGTTYGGFCADQTGTNGNISVDPLFVSKSNYRLRDGSPAIDAGDNSAPDLPSKDFAGNPRIINGYGGPTAIVDMGAYEFVPAFFAPKSLSFGLQAVGSSTSKTVKLNNALDKTLDISSLSVPTGYSAAGCGTSIAAFKSCTLTVTFHPLASGTFKGTLTAKDNAGNSPQSLGLSGSAK